MKPEIRTFFIVIFAGIIALCAVVLKQSPPAKLPATNVHAISVGEVTSVDFPDQLERHINLPKFDPEIPPGPGRGTFLAMCMTCHSLRYVTMQPAFSRKVWIAEVTKMKKVFGAPVTDKQADEIVEYLMFLRGSDAVEKPHG